MSGDTRLSDILDAVPGALDYLVSLNPADLSRLRHPVLRRYMAPRISVRRVAAMVGLSEERLVQDLRGLAEGRPPAPRAAREQTAVAVAPAALPDWLADVDLAAIPWVDVVPIDDVSGDPFPPISLAVKQLPPGGVLGIRHRWEPQPLFDIWSKMHLQWLAQRFGEREWYIFVHRPADVPSYPVKPVIGAELSQVPDPEVVPRLLALADQLAPGQAVDAAGLNPERLAAALAALKQLLGPEFSVSERDTPPQPVLRLVRAA